MLSAQGDQGAFAAVYDAVARRSYNLSMWVLGDRALAEEAMGQALIDVWRCASRFDPSKNSGQAWILSVVYRTAVEARSSADERG